MTLGRLTTNQRTNEQGHGLGPSQALVERKTPAVDPALDPSPAAAPDRLHAPDTGTRGSCGARPARDLGKPSFSSSKLLKNVLCKKKIIRHIKFVVYA